MPDITLKNLCDVHYRLFRPGQMELKTLYLIVLLSCLPFVILKPINKYADTLSKIAFSMKTTGNNYSDRLPILINTWIKYIKDQVNLRQAEIYFLQSWNPFQYSYLGCYYKQLYSSICYR